MRSRILFGVTAAAALSIGLSASASAGGGGGGYLPPGTYQFSDATAWADFPTNDGGDVSISVDRGEHHFRLRHGGTLPGGFFPVNGTVLYVSIFRADGSGGSGCWVIPDADFTQANGLTSAALHTLLPVAQNCPGIEVTMGPAGVIPSGNGGGGSLSGPLTVNVDWTYLGAVTRSQNNSSSMCLKSTYGQNGTQDFTPANATGSVSTVPSPLTTSFAVLNRSSALIRIQGVPSPLCGF